MKPQELQTLRNWGNLGEDAADTIEAQAVRLALHDPCNGRMTGEPPRYTPECQVLAERVRVLREALEACELRLTHLAQNSADVMAELKLARAALEATQ